MLSPRKKRVQLGARLHLCARSFAALRTNSGTKARSTSGTVSGSGTPSTLLTSPTTRKSSPTPATGFPSTRARPLRSQAGKHRHPTRRLRHTEESTLAPERPHNDYVHLRARQRPICAPMGYQGGWCRPPPPQAASHRAAAPAALPMGRRAGHRPDGRARRVLRGVIRSRGRRRASGGRRPAIGPAHPRPACDTDGRPLGRQAATHSGTHAGHDRRATGRAVTRAVQGATGARSLVL